MVKKFPWKERLFPLPFGYWFTFVGAQFSVIGDPENVECSHEKFKSTLADRGHVSFLLGVFKCRTIFPKWNREGEHQNTENKIVTSSVAKKNYYCYEGNYILQKKGLKMNLIFYRSDHFQSSQNGRFWTFCKKVQTPKWPISGSRFQRQEILE